MPSNDFRLRRKSPLSTVNEDTSSSFSGGVETSYMKKEREVPMPMRGRKEGIGKRCSTVVIFRRGDGETEKRKESLGEPRVAQGQPARGLPQVISRLGAWLAPARGLIQVRARSAPGDFSRFLFLLARSWALLARAWASPGCSKLQI
ncbi:hypothetical protein CCACVL1_00063 [Corchorus capsularis]|uniref:Uncharacterized protein n=1 Tax=Corchorus capsularis TaxID=210143 RepID=A0A1R3KZ07_COCAP|nr:hypothetical protein CCACVL1_00063 [Corchorus capsularis]